MLVKCSLRENEGEVRRFSVPTQIAFAQFVKLLGRLFHPDVPNLATQLSYLDLNDDMILISSDLEFNEAKKCAAAAAAAGGRHNEPFLRIFLHGHDAFASWYPQQHEMFALESTGDPDLPELLRSFAILRTLAPIVEESYQKLLAVSELELLSPHRNVQASILSPKQAGALLQYIRLQRCPTTESDPAWDAVSGRPDSDDLNWDSNSESESESDGVLLSMPESDPSSSKQAEVCSPPDLNSDQDSDRLGLGTQQLDPIGVSTCSDPRPQADAPARPRSDSDSDSEPAAAASSRPRLTPAPTLTASGSGLPVEPRQRLCEVRPKPRIQSRSQSPIPACRRPVSPTGRPVSPAGRPVSPPGRPVSPPGRPVSPPGRPVSPIMLAVRSCCPHPPGLHAPLPPFSVPTLTPTLDLAGQPPAQAQLAQPSAPIQPPPTLPPAPSMASLAVAAAPALPPAAQPPVPTLPPSALSPTPTPTLEAAAVGRRPRTLAPTPTQTTSPPAVTATSTTPPSHHPAAAATPVIPGLTPPLTPTATMAAAPCAPAPAPLPSSNPPSAAPAPDSQPPTLTQTPTLTPRLASIQPLTPIGTLTPTPTPASASPPLHSAAGQTPAVPALSPTPPPAASPQPPSWASLPSTAPTPTPAAFQPTQGPSSTAPTPTLTRAPIASPTAPTPTPALFSTLALAAVAAPAASAPTPAPAPGSPRAAGPLVRSPSGRVGLQILNEPGDAASAIVARPGMLPAPEALDFDSKFISDETIKDRSLIPAGASFKKVWKVQNTGSKLWKAGEVGLECIEGRDFSFAKGARILLNADVQPGAMYDVSVPMKAPISIGPKRCTWQLFVAGAAHCGRRFGHHLWVHIVVTERPRPQGAQEPCTAEQYRQQPSQEPCTAEQHRQQPSQT